MGRRPLGMRFGWPSAGGLGEHSLATLLGVTAVQPALLVTADVLGCPSAHTSWFGERTFPLPTHLPFLPACARVVGEGPGSQEPHADAVRNIGFNELQNEAAAADMYGWCPRPPSPTPLQCCLRAPHRIPQTLSSASSRKHPSPIPRPIPGRAATPEPRSPSFPRGLRRWLGEAEECGDRGPRGAMAGASLWVASPQGAPRRW